MRTITLVISEQVFAEMNNMMKVRTISGNAYGIMDGVISKIVTAIFNRDKEVILKYKTEVDDGRTDKGDN